MALTAASSLLLAAQGDMQMGYWEFYVFLTAMFCTIFAQLHFLVRSRVPGVAQMPVHAEPTHQPVTLIWPRCVQALALSMFDALYVVPVFQCFFIGVSTLGGATYFQEFNNFSVSR